MIYIVEPYLDIKGHFKHYFENLLSEDFCYIYCSSKNYNYNNSYFIKSQIPNFRFHFFNKLYFRLFNNIKLISFLIKKIKTKDTIHFLEFEPLTLFFFLLFRRPRKVIITIHSITAPSSKSTFQNIISKLYKRIGYLLLKTLDSTRLVLVVHYNFQKKELLKIVNKSNAVKVIEYPCPNKNVYSAKSTHHKRLLIYGQIREDKGVGSVLSNQNLENYNITIAGRIMDSKVLNLDNVTIKNKFLSEDEIDKLFATHDFLLLPYKKSYGGGAGTMKDSLAYGVPVVAVNIPVFEEVISGNDVGFVFNNFKDILFFLDETKDETYRKLSQNCLDYASEYTWASMRRKYFNLYIAK